MLNTTVDTGNYNQRIVVTGARGRIATAIIPALQKAFTEVIPVSRTSGSGHICYEDALDGNVFASASVVVYAAWSTVPVLSELHPGTEWKHDLPLLSTILELISKQGKNGPQFVFLSSAGTLYGPAGEMPSKESDPSAPVGWYGRAKVAAESLISGFAGTYGLRSLVLRISNPYGLPSQIHRPQGIVSAAIKAAHEGSTLKVWGDGTALKDYLHGEDLAAAMVRSIGCGATGTMNLCRGESHSVLDICNCIEYLTDKRIELEFSPAPEWDVKRSLICGEKFTSITGWSPTTTLEEGIRKCLDTKPLQILKADVMH